MARNIDIAISAKDNYTDALKKMQMTQTAFRKDLGQLQSELDKFNKNKIDLKVDFSKAKKELQGAEKDFKKLGDEMSRQKLESAQLNYDTVKRNLELVSSSARKTEKDMQNLTTTMSKADNRAGVGGSGGMVGALGKAGMYKMLGDTASQIANTYVSSAFGTETGSIFGSALSGAASGAAIGSIIPGIGTAVGAAVGTAIGTIQGAAQVYQNRDDAFKSTVRSEFDRVKGEETTTLQQGSSTAATRELIGAKGEVVFGGAEESKKILADVQKFALDTPFNYDMMAQQAVNMRTSGVANEDIMARIKQIGDLSMGDAAVFESVARQYTQANAKGKAQTQDLRIMAEAGVPIYEALAAVKNTDVAGVFELLGDGSIFIKDLNDAFNYLTGDGGRMNGMLDQLSGSFAMLTEQKAEMDEVMNASIGEGYNEERKKGIEADMDFIGLAGDQMAEANKAIGQWKASLENEKEQYYREEMAKALLSDEYNKAIEEGNGAEAGRIIAEAKVQAENRYRESDGYQLMLETDRTMVENMRTDLADDWYNYGYTMEQEFNKGRAAVKNYVETPEGYTPGTNPQIDYWSSDPNIRRNHANGLTYVPYDNYPAMLHQGERVLTAAEARNTGNSVSVSFGNVTVREEADINKIAEAIVRELKYAKAGNVA